MNAYTVEKVYEIWGCDGERMEVGKDREGPWPDRDPGLGRQGQSPDDHAHVQGAGEAGDRVLARTDPGLGKEGIGVMEPLPRLLVSFSGGRTSAYMSYMLKTRYSDKYDLQFVFANTGCEHEDTLRFVHEMDKRFDLGVTWVESAVHQSRKASTHTVVTYQSAARNGEPFESVTQKYGIPNHVFLHCTRELKLNPIHSYMQTVWEKGSYETAIGIRTDEMRRVRKESAIVNRIVYPLVDWFASDKQDVLSFFEDFDWDLQIPEHQGNCVTCYKKSDKKLNALYKENPSNFDFVIKLDDLYKHVGPNNVPGPRKMFRGFRSARDLVAEFERNNYDSSKGFADGGCSESCELFETEDISQ